MKKSPRLIIIPFNLPWEWSTDYTNQTAFELGKRNNFVICYMWSEYYSLFEYLRMKRLPVFIKHSLKNICLFYPIHWLPFRRFIFITQLNEKINLILLKIYVLYLTLRKNIKRKIIWIFDPQLAHFVKHFKKYWFLIYDCVDYFPGAVPLTLKKNVEKSEKLLLRKADLVVANSTILVKYLRKHRKDVRLVPQGFRLDSFKGKIINQKIKRGKRPLIGFVGAINNRIDYNLLYMLAKNNQNWDFALWGPLVEKQLFSDNQNTMYSKLHSLGNVIFGESAKDEIPGVIKEFDIGIIPYDPGLDFNRYCYPMKIFEYFYMGIPTISTDIIELRHFSELVNICRDVYHWKTTIKNNIENPLSKAKKMEAQQLAIRNSWLEKISEILNLIDQKQ